MSKARGKFGETAELDKLLLETEPVAQGNNVGKNVVPKLPSCLTQLIIVVGLKLILLVIFRRLATVEAEMCKYKSKYFLVLREFQKPRKGKKKRAAFANNVFITSNIKAGGLPIYISSRVQL